LRYAAEQAVVARLVGVGRLDRYHEGDGAAYPVAVLRAALTVIPADRSSGGRSFDKSPFVPSWWRNGEVGPPMQFLDLDDLASAIDHARRNALDGSFNVAPDGWVPEDSWRALAGRSAPVHLPAELATVFDSARLRSAGLPAGLAPYATHPWVVANDRLVATGWSPSATNEEAFVGAFRGGPLSTLDAGRRQAMSLGIAIGGVVVVAVAVVASFRRRRTRPSRSFGA
jgi:hypothetical protein